MWKDEDRLNVKLDHTETKMQEYGTKFDGIKKMASWFNKILVYVRQTNKPLFEDDTIA